jgi:hypothetical protein
MKSFKNARSLSTLGLLVALCVFSSGLARAQTSPPQDRPATQPSDIAQPPGSLTQPNQYTPAELEQFGQFLDSHPDISQRLRKNPALVNDSQFITDHPDLKAFLQVQPAIQASLMQNPEAFMAQEANLDSRENTTRADMELFNQFLDGHSDFALQVRSNPALVNDGQFVQGNPALLTFLGEHPSIRTELKQDPDALSRERYIDLTKAERDRDVHRNLVSFKAFLDSDYDVAKQLKKNPSLAKNPKFMDRYPEFQDYLSNNPGVSAALMQDPQTFIKSVEQLSSNTTSNATVTLGDPRSTR